MKATQNALALFLVFSFIACTLHAQKKKYRPGDLIGVVPKNNVSNPLLSKKDRKQLPPLPKMLFLEAGTFNIGNENTPEAKKPYVVTISALYMAETEVTNLQFCTFLNANLDSTQKLKTWIDYGKGSSKILFHNNVYGILPGYEHHPVTRVSWEGAEAYCKWISQVVNDIRESQGMFYLPNYRLPTEAEWEYAAKKGTVEKHSIEKRAWAKENSSGSPQAVKSKKKNLNKLYDLYGNVHEWCLDVFRDQPWESDKELLNPYIGAPKVKRDGIRYLIEQPPAGDRVCKGGSYLEPAQELEAYKRIARHQQQFFDDVGFRIAMTVIGRSVGGEF